MKQQGTFVRILRVTAIAAVPALLTVWGLDPRAGSAYAITGEARRQGVDPAWRMLWGRTTPSITLVRVPLHERVQYVSLPLLLLEESWFSAVQLSLAQNPLAMSLDYCRARVVNPSPTPLRLYHARTVMQHESGRVLKYQDGMELFDMPLPVVTVPPYGEATIRVDLFGVSPDLPMILPGDYTVRAEFRSPDSTEVYVSAPASIVLSRRNVREYQRFFLSNSQADGGN